MGGPRTPGQENAGQENAVCYAGRIPEDQAKEPVVYSTETIVPVFSRRSFIQVPVYRGAPQSLLLTPPNDNYFGTDGFGDVFYPNAPEPADYVSSEHAVNALIKLVTASPGEITIVCLGPLTNIALAVRLDPLFLDKVKQVIILGGSVEDLRTYIQSAAGHPAGQGTVGLIYPGRTNYSSPMASLVLTDSSQLTSDSQHLGVGNIVPGIEFNFYMDPDADFIVLNSTDTRVSPSISPIQMMPWETVLKRINISMEWRTKVLGAISTSSMALLNQAESQHLKGEYWYSSDTFAMAMALNPDLITSQTLYHANVETQGTKSRGAVFVDYDNSTDSPKNVRVVQNLDVEELKVNNIEYVLVGITQRRLVKPFVCHFRAHVTVELRAKTTSRLVLAKKLRLGRAPKFPIAYSTIQEYASFWQPLVLCQRNVKFCQRLENLEGNCDGSSRVLGVCQDTSSHHPTKHCKHIAPHVSTAPHIGRSGKPVSKSHLITPSRDFNPGVLIIGKTSSTRLTPLPSCPLKVHELRRTTQGDRNHPPSAPVLRGWGRGRGYFGHTGVTCLRLACSALTAVHLYKRPTIQ
uniref:Inosine/uridine-preferring nucleoside hydrolase domain-containing protein n=1 Tax=Timema shepardi TaxID=629360 RepID=A0A7R9AU08_TIMSH|nr:unnamed protein product [Timema shepardi]